MSKKEKEEVPEVWTTKWGVKIREPQEMPDIMAKFVVDITETVIQHLPLHSFVSIAPLDLVFAIQHERDTSCPLYSRCVNNSQFRRRSRITQILIRTGL